GECGITKPDPIVNYGQVYQLNEGYAVELEVLNKLGLHGRPAACIVESAGRYDAETTMFTAKDELGIDTKSILSILISGSPKGSLLRFESTGEDARASLDDLVGIFNDKFGEE
ncbi:HPr family phosphocarrier protein, partial [Candidatus Woesearchaeota archaeon]|nr:HPr family phosphocarrier protein [Candidatus Woesearchaeota archaeon]